MVCNRGDTLIVKCCFYHIFQSFHLLFLLDIDLLGKLDNPHKIAAEIWLNLGLCHSVQHCKLLKFEK